MRAVLHIGTEKTGSTFLQRALYKNEIQLKKRAVFLTKSMEYPNNRVLPALFQKEVDDWSFRHGASDMPGHREAVERYLPNIAAELDALQKAEGTVILSSEHCHSRLRDVEAVAALRKFLCKYFDDITVVCYFRQQYSMARSYYSTLLKGSYTESWETFVSHEVREENYYFNFLKIADVWSEEFGNDACKFRVYDRENLEGGNLFVDFLECIGLGSVKSFVNAKLSDYNKSLSGTEQQIFRLINQYFPYYQRGSQDINPVNTELKAAVRSAKLEGRVIDEGGESQEEVLQRFRVSNEVLFRKYFSEEAGFRVKDTRLDSDVRRFNHNADADDLKGILKVLEKIFKSLGDARIMTDRDIDSVRDAATLLEKESLEMASRLMQLCFRARPEGKFISQKVEQYKKGLCK